MRLALMQPYFFPYIGYFQSMVAVDRFVLYDKLNYITDGYMHRNSYLQAGAGKRSFIVPIRAKSPNLMIDEVQTAEETRWRDKLKKTITQTYRRSPEFETVFPLFAAVIDSPTESLAQINAAGIAMVHDYLSIPCTLVPDASDYAEVEAQLAVLYAEGAPPQEIERKVMRAFLACAANGAEIFINAIGGRALYDPALFARHGIDLWFVESELPEYQQFNSREFVSGLSILDMLFNCERDHARSLLQRYRLVR